MKPVGFIGLGNMGSKMVGRLLKAGHTVIGYNRTKEKATTAHQTWNAMGRLSKRCR